MRVGSKEAGGMDITVYVCLVLYPFYLVLVRPCLPLWSLTLVSSVTCGFTPLDLVWTRSTNSVGWIPWTIHRTPSPMSSVHGPILHAPLRLSHSSCEDTRSIAIVHGSLRPPRVVSCRREETPIWAWVRGCIEWCWREGSDTVVSCCVVLLL